MSLDQGHRQLADFADQGLETLGFLHPFSDLLEKILGHVNGACLATVPEGDVVGLVQRATVMAGAGRLAAAFVHLHEAGRQDGAGGNKLLESPVQHPADQCRVAGNTHGWARRTSGISTLHRKRVKKPAVRRKKEHPPRPIASTEVLLWTCAAVKVRGISPFLKVPRRGHDDAAS